MKWFNVIQLYKIRKRIFMFKQVNRNSCFNLTNNREYIEIERVGYYESNK